MQLSMEWLSQYLDLSDYTGLELADLMSRTGIEVERVINYGKDLNNLVVGYVEKAEPIEESDNLNLTQVIVEEGSDPIQIVCGAPNIQAGRKVMVAMVGAVLPGDFKIKKAKLMGYESNGMICSYQELGLDDSVVPVEFSKGIVFLPDEAPIGADLVEYLGLDDDILELDLTPNRADALSVRGCVYEIAAITNQEPKFEVFDEYEITTDTSELDQVKIEVESPELSPHYQLRLIKNVTIEESPLWLQVRLMKSGIRPINNVVDLTNYFLLLYGQPMHSFDYDAMEEKTIRVHSAPQGQKFTTLDGVERTLCEDDILIMTGDQPAALAGVMGGLDSEVTKDTKNILLETAVFDPLKVRLTSQRYHLRSESSSRFEKGINLATIDEAGQACAGMIAKLGGGVVVEGKVEEKNIEAEDSVVEVGNSALTDKIGIDLSNEEIEEIINRLGFSVKFAEDSYTVTVPPRRWDIKIEADVLEEIARIYGYDNIPTTLPVTEATPGHLTDHQKLVRTTRRVSEGMGLNQVISYNLISPKRAQILHSDKPFIELLYPMSEDRKVLRQSMLPALLEVAQFNRARQNTDLAFYETGRVFASNGKGQMPDEEERYAILLSGKKQASTWYSDEVSYDFYDLKGILEECFVELLVDKAITYEACSDIEPMHPGRTAKVYLDGDYLGFFGQVHPNVSQDYDLPAETFFAELDLEMLSDFKRELIKQKPIPKYPSTARDLALLVDVDQTHSELVQIIESNATSDLVSVDLFDYYDGESIEEGKKSLAYHLTFRNPEKTLTDEDVNLVMDKITKALEAVDGLTIR